MSFFSSLLRSSFLSPSASFEVASFSMSLTSMFSALAAFSASDKALLLQCRFFHLLRSLMMMAQDRSTNRGDIH